MPSLAQLANPLNSGHALDDRDPILRHTVRLEVLMSLFTRSVACGVTLLTLFAATPARAADFVWVEGEAARKVAAPASVSSYSRPEYSPKGVARAEPQGERGRGVLSRAGDDVQLCVRRAERGDV